MTKKGIAVAAATAMVVLSVPTAFAHDVVIGGSPANGEVVQEFPDTLTLEFSGQPREGFNSFAVTDQDSSEVLFSAEPTIDGRNLTVEVPEGIEPGAGNYRIGFQITSSDGHATRGWSDFTVEGQADAPASEEPATGTGQAENAEAQETQAPAEALPLWALIGIGLVAVLAIFAVVVLIIRKGKASEDLRSHNPDQDHPENN